MVLIGVVLVLLALAAGGVLAAGTARIDDTVDVEVFGVTASFPPLLLLVTGMVVISGFWLGWAVLRSGLRRNRRQRADAAEAAREAEARRTAEEQRLREEIAARDAELAEERRLRSEAEQRSTTPGGTAVAPAAAPPHTSDDASPVYRETADRFSASPPHDAGYHETAEPIAAPPPPPVSRP
ncbi:MAG: hypothetical protein ACRCXL_10525 [Dermatophilaceae bacterium]